MLPVVLLLCVVGEAIVIPENELYELDDVKSMTFSADERTTSRRTPSFLQMECVGGSSGCAAGLLPRTANCTNIGYVGTDVAWNCTFDLTSYVEVVDTLVVCEGYGSDDDSRLFPGSCGLKYILEQVVPLPTVDLRKDIRRLYFYAGKHAHGLDMEKSPQMQFLGEYGPAVTPDVLPEEVTCRRVGLSTRGTIDWKCEAELNYHLDFSRVSVSCEGVLGEDGERSAVIVYADSCVVLYDLYQVTEADEAVRLHSLESLHFKHHVFINGPGYDVPLRQAICHGECPKEAMKEITCINANFGSASVFTAEWLCESSELPSSYAIMDPEVACHGVASPNDVFVAPDSCRLTYEVRKKGKLGEDGRVSDPRKHDARVDRAVLFDDRKRGITVDLKLLLLGGFMLSVAAGGTILVCCGPSEDKAKSD